MEPEEIAFHILNKSIDISIQHIRDNIRTQMDENGNVNGFALLTALRAISQDLKIQAKRGLINEIN